PSFPYQEGKLKTKSEQEQSKWLDFRVTNLEGQEGQGVPWIECNADLISTHRNHLPGFIATWFLVNFFVLPVLFFDGWMRCVLFGAIVDLHLPIVLRVPAICLGVVFFLVVMTWKITIKQVIWPVFRQLQV
ncbi:MAG: hypothetical protein ABSA33_04150, partial [Candidatus Micrarchaeaceae archaeon]